MKTLRKISIVCALFVSTMAVACNDKKNGQTQQGNGNAVTNSAETIPEEASEPKSGEITFKKGKLIEVAVLTIAEGMETQFFEDYFSQAIKLAPKYEARPIASFAIEKTEAGNSPAKMIVFFEWGSLEKKRAFERDFDFLKIKHLRSGALSYLSTGYFSVGEDVTYTVTEGKTYEFAALWLDPENAPKLEKYFNAVLPLAGDPKIQFQLIAQL